MDEASALEVVGRKGRIQWLITGEWYRARVVDYNRTTRYHKVIWLEDWAYTELLLGNESRPEFGIHLFWLDNPSPRATLPGMRIFLEPSWTEFFGRYGNGKNGDYRACVVKRADEAPGYYVFYLGHNVTATVELRNVKFIVLDPTNDRPIEVRNPTAPKIQLEPPLLIQEHGNDYIAANLF